VNDPLRRDFTHPRKSLGPTRKMGEEKPPLLEKRIAPNSSWGSSEQQEEREPPDKTKLTLRVEIETGWEERAVWRGRKVVPRLAPRPT